MQGCVDNVSNGRKQVWKAVREVMYRYLQACQVSYTKVTKVFVVV